MRLAPIASLAVLALACAACSQADENAGPAPTESLAPSALPDASEPAPTPTPPGSPSARNPAALDPQGLGDIVVGQAPPASLKADAVQISDGCRTHTDKARGIYAMTDGKVVTRVTAMRASKVQTATGIGLGASEAAVRRAYPDARVEPHKYVEAPAKYLDWRPGDGKSGLRFEIDAEGQVTAIHAGREPYVSYVEGCA